MNTVSQMMNNRGREDEVGMGQKYPSPPRALGDTFPEAILFGASMSTWHRLGTKDELLARAPFAVKLDRHTIAVFPYQGQVRAISNTCNHKGGPLCEGRLRGEFVMCPWHGWEYSVITGKGPRGTGGRRRGVRDRGAP
jgi:nitrite reductase/ring-hydroxylating ferredoxin subunit